MSKAIHDRSAIESFSKVPAFAEVDFASLKALASVAISRKFASGEVIFIEGEPCAGLYIVKSGWLKSIKISPNGREQIIRVVGPGEVFNDIGVFANGDNLITVEALEAAETWIIPRQALLHMIDEHPLLCQVVIENLAKRIIYLMSLVEDLSLRTVEARLARYLLEQATKNSVSRKRWATQAELAARLGTVPDVLNRAMRNLVEKGLIQLDRQQIDILDRKELDALAGQIN